MSAISGLDCSNCYERYSSERPAMQNSCGHTFCSVCVASVKKCLVAGCRVQISRPVQNYALQSIALLNPKKEILGNPESMLHQVEVEKLQKGDCECPICYQEYSAEVKPKIISCGHTVCSDCLANIQTCPLDRKPFTVARDNHMLLNALKSDSKIHPVLAEIERLEENMKGCMQIEDGFPTTAWQCFSSFDKTYEGLWAIIQRTENKFPNLNMYAKYLFGQLHWARTLLLRSSYDDSERYSFSDSLRSYFDNVIRPKSKTLLPYPMAYFASAFMELHKSDLNSPIDYDKVVRYFTRIKEAGYILPAHPMHPLIASFYLTVLEFKEQNIDYVKVRGSLLALSVNPILPKNFRAFANLMLAELFLLGLGGDKDTSRSLRFLEAGLKLDPENQKVKAKMLYWMGVIHKNSFSTATFVPDPKKSLEYFQEACELLNVENQAALEGKFHERVGHHPYYERFLSLHLDPRPSTETRTCIIS